MRGTASRRGMDEGSLLCADGVLMRVCMRERERERERER